MGMYTELILGCRLKEETPKEIIETLRWLFADNLRSENPPHTLPGKPDSRISWMFSSAGSYYFGAISGERRMSYDKIAKSYRLTTRFNIKNYDNEIEDFLAWLKPWIEQGSGEYEMYAITTYEAGQPIIHSLNEQNNRRSITS